MVLVEERVRRAVAARRQTDPDPDDAFRGLYLTDEAVDRLLRTPPRPAAPDRTDAARHAEAETRADTADPPTSLRRLTTAWA